MADIGNFKTNFFPKHFSVLLIYFSYLTVLIAKSPYDVGVLFSTSSLALIVVSIVIQVLFIISLRLFDKDIIKFIYLLFLFSSFTFLNLTNVLFKIVGLINSHVSFLLRFRDVLLGFLLILFFIAYFSKRNFLLTLRVINTFLISFIVLNIFYGIFLNSASQEVKKLELKYNSKSDEFKPLKTLGSKGLKKNILFILIDEYSPPEEIIKFNNDTSQTYLLKNYLLSKGFTVLKNRTLKTLTVNSLNMLFNKQSGLTFRNESFGNAHSELRYSTVINSLERKGYIFNNFGFFNIGNSIPFFNWKNPYQKSDYEKLLNYSLFPFISANLKEDSASNGDYNKNLELESLKFLKKIPANQSHFVYVHFLMPHGPFYWENEFSYKKRNLKNYIAYWNFCNRKIIKYLESINDISSFKIIITGDHGFKFNIRMIDAYLTMSAFYNFDEKEIKKISTVQDIGNLLLAQ